MPCAGGLERKSRCGVATMSQKGGGSVPWGLSEVKPGSVKTLALDKKPLGVQRKSRFQKVGLGDMRQ